MPEEASALFGSLPELGEERTLESPPPSPPPPPPPAPPREPEGPRANPEGDPPRPGGSWLFGRHQKLGVFLSSLTVSSVLALVFGPLAGDLWPGTAAATFWTAQNIVKLLFVGSGLTFGIAYAIHDSSFSKTLFGVGVVFAALLAGAYAFDAAGRPALAPGAAVVADSMPPAQPAASPEGYEPDAQGARPTVPMPDGSDVEHRGGRKNVAVGRPGQRVKHPILLQNRGQTWWRDRLLCREGGEQDSRAIVSAAACIAIDTVPPGESVELTLEFTAPPVPGWYVARWKQATQETGFVYRDAEPVILHVHVNERY